jgi:integrase
VGREPEARAALPDPAQEAQEAARALEWGILTAARSQEIRGARRSEVDIRLKRWTIPATRMKAEKDLVVPSARHTADEESRADGRVGTILQSGDTSTAGA